VFNERIKNNNCAKRNPKIAQCAQKTPAQFQNNKSLRFMFSIYRFAFAIKIATRPDFRRMNT